MCLNQLTVLSVGETLVVSYLLVHLYAVPCVDFGYLGEVLTREGLVVLRFVCMVSVDLKGHPQQAARRDSGFVGSSRHSSNDMCLE